VRLPALSTQLPYHRHPQSLCSNTKGGSGLFQSNDRVAQFYLDKHGPPDLGQLVLWRCATDPVFPVPDPDDPTAGPAPISALGNQEPFGVGKIVGFEDAQGNEVAAPSSAAGGGAHLEDPAARQAVVDFETSRRAPAAMEHVHHLEVRSYQKGHRALLLDDPRVPTKLRVEVWDVLDRDVRRLKLAELRRNKSDVEVLAHWRRLVSEHAAGDERRLALRLQAQKLPSAAEPWRVRLFQKCIFNPKLDRQVFSVASAELILWAPEEKILTPKHAVRATVWADVYRDLTEEPWVSEKPVSKPDPRGSCKSTAASGRRVREEEEEGEEEEEEEESSEEDDEDGGVRMSTLAAAPHPRTGISRGAKRPRDYCDHGESDFEGEEAGEEERCNPPPSESAAVAAPGSASAAPVQPTHGPARRAGQQVQQASRANRGKAPTSSAAAPAAGSDGPSHLEAEAADPCTYAASRNKSKRVRK
jgi:hypothetical protein